MSFVERDNNANTFIALRLCDVQWIDVFKSFLNCSESTAGSRKSGSEFQTVSQATEKNTASKRAAANTKTDIWQCLADRTCWRPRTSEFRYWPDTHLVGEISWMLDPFVVVQSRQRFAVTVGFIAPDRTLWAHFSPKQTKLKETDLHRESAILHRVVP